MANDSCNARPAQGPKRMQGTARGRCFRFPYERPNEHSPYRMANDSCNARPAQGPKRMQGTARGRCFRFPYERPNEHSPYRMANDSCNARPAQGRSGCRAPQEGAASASRTKVPTSIRHSLLCVAEQTNRAARAPFPCDRQCSAAAHKRITTVILLPYHKQQTARRRPAPGCLLFFPLYKTELNQYNKVRSIKHRRRPS